ncbi:MAG TPA: DUF5074 domain-containing protein [Edaphocola sp.]|nr:DUF5074 domain-containing protein [Edaphocola sp.]
MKDVPDRPGRSDIPTGGRKVWIANEGSLGNGNASLSLLFPDKDSVFNDVFRLRNNQDLGDVFQSMTIVGNRLFLAINNSDKIKVVNKDDFQLLGSIDIPKPRYMLLLDSSKMYVSSLFYPEINIVNPNSMQVTGQIATDFPNTEGLLAFRHRVYACNWDTACSYIYEIAPQSNQITHRIPIAGRAPQQVLVDKLGRLWVLAGNVGKRKPSTLTCIDPQSRSIVRSFRLPDQAEVIKPVWNKSRDTLYFLGVDYNGGTSYNGVFRMAISDTVLPSEPLIPAQPLQYFWGLGVDSATGNIYVGDPKGFIQSGEVLIYNTFGHLLKRYAVGLGPGFFLFE